MVAFSPSRHRRCSEGGLGAFSGVRNRGPIREDVLEKRRWVLGSAGRRVVGWSLFTAEREKDGHTDNLRSLSCAASHGHVPFLRILQCRNHTDTRGFRRRKKSGGKETLALRGLLELVKQERMMPPERKRKGTQKNEPVLKQNEAIVSTIKLASLIPLPLLSIRLVPSPPSQPLACFVSPFQTPTQKSVCHVPNPR